MKKIIIILALSVLSIVSFSQQKKSKSEKQAEFEKSLLTAVEESSFTFTALTMKSSLGKVLPVDVPEKTIDVRPNHFMAEIVYDDVLSTAYKTPEYILIDMPSYTYSADSTDKMFMVNLIVENLPKTPINPNSKFTFTFKIKRKTGSTTLEVKPDVTHPITYVGTIMPE